MKQRTQELVSVLIAVMAMSGCSTSGGTTDGNNTIVSFIHVGDLEKPNEECITTDTDN